MHNIHKDTLNFHLHFDENYYKNIELVYPGNNIKLNKETPAMLVVTGTSGAGKDTIVDYINETFSNIEQVRTATTRVRRFDYAKEATAEMINDFKIKLDRAEEENKEEILEQAESEGLIVREPESKYVWMRAKGYGETQDQYFKNLVKEYDLIEYDYHYGNLYGVPRKSVEDILSRGKVPLFRVDISGAININNLFSADYNVLVITVLPDKRDDVVSRIATRKSHKGDKGEFVDVRKTVMHEEYSKFNLVTHYYLRNTVIKKDGMVGMERSFRAISSLINHLDIDTKAH